jgi:hypothetical protein
MSTEGHGSYDERPHSPAPSAKLETRAAVRLLILADFLETVPRESFEIKYWVDHPATKPEGGKPGECGFAGCAIGWAAHARLFDGLTLDVDAPRYAGLWDYDAVSACFGINDCDAAYLFDGCSYNWRATPKQVARRIRAFVKRNDALAIADLKKREGA